MLGLNFSTHMPQKQVYTSLDVEFVKPGVMSLSWTSEVPKSVLAPGEAGAVLMRVAFRSRREICASVRRMIVMSLCSVLKGEEVRLRFGIIILFMLS